MNILLPWHPGAETRYSNIEHECLAVTFGLEEFEYYLQGRHTLIETDNAPLEQIFKKNIAESPLRLQRMLVKCLRFDKEVQYKKGQLIPLADGLSRVCFGQAVHSLELSHESDIHFITDIPCPVSLDLIKCEIAKDPAINKLKEVIYNGWPEYRKQCPYELWEYWNFRCDLVLEDGIPLKGDRIIIPKSLRASDTRWPPGGDKMYLACPRIRVLARNNQ